MKLGFSVLVIALVCGCYEVEIYLRKDGSGLRTETVILDREWHDRLAKSLPLNELTEKRVKAIDLPPSTGPN